MNTIVVFDKQNKEIAKIKATPGISILSMLEQNNISISSLCRRGICGTCMRKIIKGQEFLTGLYQSNITKNQKDTILVCAITVKNDNNSNINNIDIDNEIWIQEM